LNGQLNAGSRHVLTANDLRSGAIVYLGVSGWCRAIEQARLLDDGDIHEAMERAAASEAACEVIGCYLIEVDSDGRQPVKLRERLRAVRHSGHSVTGVPLAGAA